MIELARPGFLWGGIALAALPLLLHFLRPRERSRKLLPTVRFLTADRRTFVRPRRTPDQLLLLALRMAGCVALGAAFAGASWVGRTEGTGTVLVVEASAVSGVGSSLASLVAELDPPPSAVAVVHASVAGSVSRSAPGSTPGSGEGAPRVTRMRPEEALRPESWESIGSEGPDGSEGPGGSEDPERREPVRLAHLLRALRDAAALTTGVDSLAARIVAVPRWSGWGPGLPELREELWPGRIGLVVPREDEAPRGGAPDGGAGAGEERATTRGADDDPWEPLLVQVEGPELPRTAVERAFQALGHRVADAGTIGAGDSAGEPEPEAMPATPTGLPPGSPDAVLRIGPEDGIGPLWEPSPGVAGPAPDDASTAEPSQDVPGAEPPADLPFLLLDGRVVPGAGPPPAGTPSGDAAVPLLRVGGRPAGAARRPSDTEAPCELALPLDADAPILESGDLALVAESLVEHGCGLHAADLLGAEEAWRAVLEGDPSATARPEVLPAAQLRGPSAGIPLTRWLLAAVLALLFLEGLRARDLEAGRSDEREDNDH